MTNNEPITINWEHGSWVVTYEGRITIKAYADSMSQAAELAAELMSSISLI